jgi:hypothetical protein
VTNPYEPPRANVESRNDERGSLPKAIAIGVLIDIGGSIAVGFAAAILYGIVLGATGHSEEQIALEFETLDTWSAFSIISIVLGLAISAFAGYQCARIANRDGYLGPGILAMISCALGALLSGGTYSQAELLILSVLSVVAVLGGASIFVMRRRAGRN